MHVLQLPVDILIAIFSHLTASRDLYSCNQICRAIHNLFRSSPQLYHKLSLARASLADTLYGVQNKSLQDRTRLVLELEQRWCSRTLSSRRQLKIPLDNPCIEYQICNGVIVTGVLSSTGDSLQELQVYRLPSYLTGLKSKLWRHKLEKDSSVRQLKVDPSQDLLVLTGVGPPDSVDLGTKCTVSLYLRTLSTNDNHPAASLATLSLKGVLPTQPFMHPYSQGRIVVRICQDILGVLTNPDSTDPVAEGSVQSLVIWQWTSGQQILTLPQLDNLLINDLMFLGRHTILLTHSTTLNGPGVSVLHLALGRPYANSPVTSTTPMDSLETSTFFHFPSSPVCSHECIRMGSIKITSEPPIDISWPALEGKNHVPRVFTPDPSEATSIVAFSLSIHVRAFGSTRTNTIKHTLLTRASVFSARAVPYSKRFYTFDEWSSEDTYWFSGEPGFIHGQRYTLTSFQQPRTNVEVYDFNPCHAEIPDSGWFALLKEGKSKLAHGIVPKLSAHRTRCGHKRYLDSELKSTMHCKRQCMKAGLARLHDRVISALDGESVITIELERGGLVRGFVAYNI